MSPDAHGKKGGGGRGPKIEAARSISSMPAPLKKPRFERAKV